MLDVEVLGVAGELRENVLAGLSIERRRREPNLWAGLVEWLDARAPDEIRAALQPFGHYAPRIEAELAETPAGWRARYRIEPGEPVRVAALDVRVTGDGAADPELTARAAAFSLRPGAPLRHDLYEEGKLELLGAAAERGYLEARLTAHRVAVDTATREARVTVRLETGPRHRFGAVEFAGSELEDAVLQGFVPFRPGDPYGTEALLALQRALIATDLFRSVDVTPRPERAEALAVPVEVTLEERPRRLFSVGGGYGTDTGPRGRAEAEVRRLNRWGHRLSWEAQGSLRRSGASARYLVPVGAAGDQLAFSAGVQDERPATHWSRTLLLGGSLNHRRASWQERLYVMLQQERFEVGGERGTTRLVLPGARWTRTRSDHPVHTTRGSRLALEVRGTDPAIGSRVAFAQAAGQAKLVRSPHVGGRLLLRADLGYTAVGALQRLPPSLRFFAGGDQSVRGYAYNALGPTDEEGLPSGGRHLLVGSAEYERRMAGDWSAAAFYDAGNALNGFGDGIHHGAGVGARWRSPVGLVRVDVAVPVSAAERRPRLHIVIGPDL